MPSRHRRCSPPPKFLGLSSSLSSVGMQPNSFTRAFSSSDFFGLLAWPQKLADLPAAINKTEINTQKYLIFKRINTTFLYFVTVVLFVMQRVVAASMTGAPGRKGACNPPFSLRFG